MSLVSMDDRSYQPRVLPNVFSDLPSQSELVSAKADLADAKRSRSGLTLLVILLAGMLIAAGAALFFLYSDQGSPQVVTDLQRRNEILTGQVTTLTEQQRQLGVRYASVENLTDQLAGGNAVRDQIATVVQQRPWTANAAGNYRQSIWSTEQPRVIQALQRETDTLTLLKARLERIPEPIVRPAPGPGTITPAAPGRINP